VEHDVKKLNFQQISNIPGHQRPGIVDLRVKNPKTAPLASAVPGKEGSEHLLPLPLMNFKRRLTCHGQNLSDLLRKL
jgi:hypothetical protein